MTTYREVLEAVKKIHSAFPIVAKPAVIAVSSSNSASLLRMMVDAHFNTDHLEENIEIRDVEVDPGEGNLFAMYRNYSNKKIIISVCTNNTCWKRFMVTKELCHMLSDGDDEHKTNDVIGLIHDIVSRKILVDPDKFSLDFEIRSEYLNVIFSFELLCPIRFNYLLKDKNVTSYEIASTFRIPESIVDTFRSEWYTMVRDQALNASLIS